MTALVLDSQALSNLARTRRGQAPGLIHAALKAAVKAECDVIVPAAVLAEQYRGGPFDQVVDSCLGRFSGISVVDTTRSLAPSIGHLLARAGRGSRDHVDATVVAVALAAGGGLIVTSDVADLVALSVGLDSITVEAI